MEEKNTPMTKFIQKHYIMLCKTNNPLLVYIKFSYAIIEKLISKERADKLFTSLNVK